MTGKMNILFYKKYSARKVLVALAMNLFIFINHKRPIKLAADDVPLPSDSIEWDPVGDWENLAPILNV